MNRKREKKVWAFSQGMNVSMGRIRIIERTLNVAFDR